MSHRGSRKHRALAPVDRLRNTSPIHIEKKALKSIGMSARQIRKVLKGRREGFGVSSPN